MTIITIIGVMTPLVIGIVYCIYTIRQLQNQINSHLKEISSLKKSATYHGMALNDLADIVTSKSYAAFPLIGQPGKA